MAINVWHGERIDTHGNVACLKCGKAQSPYFMACIYCCTHEILEFTEQWDCGWRLDVYCSICGKNFDFSKDVLIREYKAVRKEA